MAVRGDRYSDHEWRDHPLEMNVVEEEGRSSKEQRWWGTGWALDFTSIIAFSQAGEKLTAFPVLN